MQWCCTVCRAVLLLLCCGLMCFAVNADHQQRVGAAFQKDLHDLTYQVGSLHTSKACLICDRLLEWKDKGFISKTRLKSLQKYLTGTAEVFRDMPEVLKHQYTYMGKGNEDWMESMYLSPRGVYEPSKGFQCCNKCGTCLGGSTQPRRIELPRFAIANGMLTGYAPMCLRELTEVELVLVSRARIDKHVFSFFGGAHKSIYGWHNLYENDVENVARALQQVETFGGGKVVACILQGPFTAAQREHVKRKTTIRSDKVLFALRWLKQHNRVYNDIQIPSAEQLPQPVILDDSNLVEAQNTDIEARFEYTVVFPDTDTINPTNGGCMSQTEFRANVIDAIDRSNTVTVASRPTQNRLKDYEGDALLKAFPLQFPFGYGIPPPTAKQKSPNNGMSKLAYLQHMQMLSTPAMHRGDFVLVMHNMYERQRAVSLAYLRCKHKVGDTAIASHFADMTLSQLQASINRRQSDMPVHDPVSRQFLQSVDATCKSLGHTNEAAKRARLSMFANIVRFGPGSLFLTVTPDDGNCFRIQIYANHQIYEPPNVDDPSDAITADFDMSIHVREQYPGLCAFDFNQITELLIEHILGWDAETHASKADGGMFGRLNTYTCAVEEQGRKTLHGHWILWVQEWSDLMKRLHSSNMNTRDSAVRDLTKYIDSIMSTKLFGGLNARTLPTAHEHVCNTDDEVSRDKPMDCTNQDLRNLRYKHGDTSFGGGSIAQCESCKKSFTSKEMYENMLNEWFGGEAQLEKKLKLAVKRYSGGLDAVAQPNERVRRDFVIQALQNLHNSTHTTSCWKKGDECRMKLPEPPCECTTVHFDDDDPMRWYTWNGVMEQQSALQVECRRHVYDVFMNRFQPFLSNVLGCNTNVQCGIDGGHIMYVTYYASKGTQTEDKLAYCKVAKTLYKRLRKQQDEHDNPADENQTDPPEAPTPFTEGYRRLLSAVLSHTSAHVVSAPMAWFIVRNQSRFLFGHDSAYIGLEGFLGKQTTSPLMFNNQHSFLLDKVKDYVFRPMELVDVSLYDFVMNYVVVNRTKKNEDEIMPFASNHPQGAIRGVLERDIPVTPLVSFMDFPDASGFNNDLLDESVEATPDMEKFSKSALLLFHPFNEMEVLSTSNNVSFTARLREAVANGKLDQTAQQRLQNIQDCRNMLNAGRRPDILEKTTDPLAPSERSTREDSEPTEEVNNYIEAMLTELVAQLDEDDNLLTGNSNGNASPYVHISMADIRQRGKNDCGYGGVRPVELRNTRQVYKFADGTTDGTSGQTETNAPSSFNLHAITKAKLTTLGISSIRREVSNITELSHIRATGSAASVQKFAQIAFADKQTGEVDQTQKRAFEVIASTLLLTFHKDADLNDGLHDVGVQPPRLRHRYVNLRRDLKTLSGMERDDQLIMFLTGQAGSGKSEVINTVLAYARAFCKEIDYPFDKHMIVVTAMTGVAATLINGETLHSAAHINTDKIKSEHIQTWKATRLVIVDEISFAPKEVLGTMNEKLGLLKERVRARYGGINIIFTGDFSQLEPIKKPALYKNENFAPWVDWINCFIELEGMHRFREDPEYGYVMRRFRQGRPTRDDIAYINTRVINDNDMLAPKISDLPNDIAYATATNADRCAINTGMFMEHIAATHSTSRATEPPSHTIIIRSDEVNFAVKSDPLNPKSRYKRGPGYNRSAKHILWSRCVDCDVKTADLKNAFVDPCLKLHTGMQLMYTENDDVPNKKANGTLCYLKSIQLHENVTEADFEPMNLDGFWVRSIDASKVDYLLCQIAGSTKCIEVFAKSSQCHVKMPIALIPGEETNQSIRSYMNRFPVLSNNATTGHKLQGQTKASLFVSDWCYTRNWPYVVLSRVKTLKGLFLRRQLDPDADYSHDPRLTSMLDRFRRNCAPADCDIDFTAQNIDEEL